MKNRKPDDIQKDISKDFDLQEALLDGINTEKLLEMVAQLHLSHILNKLMLFERESYLNENPNDSANGFYERTLHWKNLPMRLSVPRTRSSDFFPSTLPKYKRALPESYGRLVEALLLSARSIDALKDSIRGMGLPVSSDSIERMVERLACEFEDYTMRELDSDWLVLYVDAKELEVKEDKRVKKMTLITAVGVNMEGRREVVGSRLYEGRESLEKWRDFLLGLKKRGMVRVLLIVTDNFPGVVNLVKGIFPMAFHQLCLVHLIRNGKLHLSKDAYKRFREWLDRVSKASDFETAYTFFLEMIDWLNGEAPHFAEELRKKAEQYVVFSRFPMELRSRLKSTNASENLHKELERIRINSGGYFQTREIFYAKWQIFLRRLREKRWSKPEPRFKGVLPELHRMFREIYESEANLEIN